MQYPAIVTEEGRATLAEFPNCPGCQTFADPGEEIVEQAQDALHGWLEATLAAGEVPPKPSVRIKAPKGARVLWIPVPAKLAVKLSLRWQRQEAGLTQAQLARRANVSQQQIAKLEHPDSNPTIETLEKVAKALGTHLEIRLVASGKSDKGLALQQPGAAKRLDLTQLSTEAREARRPRPPAELVGTLEDSAHGEVGRARFVRPAKAKGG